MKIIQTSYKVAVRKGKASETVLITLFRVKGLRLRKKVLVRR